MTRPRILIAGCGFLGLAAARIFHREGWEVIGCTHSEESAAALALEPFRVVRCDLGEMDSVRRLREFRGLDAIVHSASSGRGGAEQYRRVYLQGARHLQEALAPKTVLFTSSTSVYAQTGGEWVTEESPAEPDRETGRILRETEEFVRASNGIVARVAGIYGPGRSVLLRKFLAGEAVIEGDGERMINQIHRDDAAAAYHILLQRGERGIFNVADDTPLAQRAVYSWLAEHFQRPLPPYGPVDLNRKRGWTHKRVSNAKLRAIGWVPRFPAFFDAVEGDAELAGTLGERVTEA